MDLFSTLLFPALLPPDCIPGSALPSAFQFSQRPQETEEDERKVGYGQSRSLCLAPVLTVTAFLYTTMSICLPQLLLEPIPIEPCRISLPDVQVYLPVKGYVVHGYQLDGLSHQGRKGSLGARDTRHRQNVNHGLTPIPQCSSSYQIIHTSKSRNRIWGF